MIPDETRRTRLGQDDAFLKRRFVMSKAWIMLTLAGFLETGWAIGLKYTQGFTKPIPSLFTLIAIIASMYLLARSAQELPIGTAYAVWVGIGSLGAVIFGVILFNEPLSLSRVFFASLLLISIIGLKLTASH
jgi:quaternary ammonium compound-resistance protein SugE